VVRSCGDRGALLAFGAAVLSEPGYIDMTPLTAASGIPARIPERTPADLGDRRAQAAEGGTAQRAVVPRARACSLLPLVDDVPRVVDGEHLEASIGVACRAGVTDEVVELTWLPAAPAVVRRRLPGIVEPRLVCPMWNSSKRVSLLRMTAGRLRTMPAKLPTCDQPLLMAVWKMWCSSPSVLGKNTSIRPSGLLATAGSPVHGPASLPKSVQESLTAVCCCQA
jgi:hypothetical protein